MRNETYKKGHYVSLHGAKDNKVFLADSGADNNSGYFDINDFQGRTSAFSIYKP